MEAEDYLRIKRHHLKTDQAILDRVQKLSTRVFERNKGVPISEGFLVKVLSETITETLIEFDLVKIKLYIE